MLCSQPQARTKVTFISNLDLNQSSNPNQDWREGRYAVTSSRTKLRTIIHFETFLWIGLQFQMIQDFFSEVFIHLLTLKLSRLTGACFKFAGLADGIQESSSQQ